jgi:hypothetical protein
MKNSEKRYIKKKYKVIVNEKKRIGRSKSQKNTTKKNKCKKHKK